jgi:hypothetical protein
MKNYVVCALTNNISCTNGLKKRWLETLTELLCHITFRGAGNMSSCKRLGSSYVFIPNGIALMIILFTPTNFLSKQQPWCPELPWGFKVKKFSFLMFDISTPHYSLYTMIYEKTNIISMHFLVYYVSVNPKHASTYSAILVLPCWKFSLIYLLSRCNSLNERTTSHYLNHDVLQTALWINVGHKELN